jgi:hypothetical protein
MRFACFAVLCVFALSMSRNYFMPIELEGVRLILNAKAQRTAKHAKADTTGTGGHLRGRVLHINRRGR